MMSSIHSERINSSPLLNLDLCSDADKFAVITLAANGVEKKLSNFEKYALSKKDIRDRRLVV